MLIGLGGFDERRVFSETDGACPRNLTASIEIVDTNITVYVIYKCLEFEAGRATRPKTDPSVAKRIIAASLGNNKNGAKEKNFNQ